MVSFIRRVLVLLAIVACAEVGARSFSVDDLLKMEGTGIADFSPDGRYVAVEVMRPYELAAEYGRPWLNGKDRAGLLLWNTEAGKPPIQLGHGNGGDWLGAFSPQGSRLAFYRVERGRVQAGVHEVRTGHETLFDFHPEMTAFEVTAAWISDDELLYIALPDMGTPSIVATERRTAEALPALWQRAWSGVAPTADVLASGNARRVRSQSQQKYLVRANARLGTYRQLAAGPLEELYVSTNTTHVAVLQRSEPTRSQRLFDRNTPRSVHGLRLLRLDEGTHSVDMCPACDVIPGSVQWSQDGNKVLFVSLRRAGEDSRAEIMVYSLVDDRLYPVAAGSIEPDVEWRANARPIRATWLGEDVLLYGRPKSTGSRSDWYRVSPSDKAYNVTSAFASAPRELLAISSDSFIVDEVGTLWRVSGDGLRRRITASREQFVGMVSQVGPWPMLRGFPRRGIENSLLATIRTATGRSVVSYEADAARSPVHVSRVSSDGSILAASVTAGKSLMRQDVPGGGSQLVSMSAAGRRDELATFNRHLIDVQEPRWMRLNCRNGIREAPASWLLLPAQEATTKFPLVVDVYPGRALSDAPPRHLADVAPFSPYILAGAGYAVLFPNMPLSAEGVADDVPERILPSLDDAVNCAIAGGYVDPQRLALFGSSFGGYAVLTTITRTDRFRAAVAAAPLANLASAYGSFDVRYRVGTQPDDMARLLRQASLMETGQGRMGAPPWRDPERYVRNSPIFRVDKINTPVVIVQGDMDYVPMRQGEEMFTALLREDKEALFVRYWGEGHGLQSPSNIRDFWSRILDWYGQHLQ